MKLGHTRRMAVGAESIAVATAADPIFGLEIPRHVEGVPDSVLEPRATWKHPVDYARAKRLAEMFTKNFEVGRRRRRGRCGRPWPLRNSEAMRLRARSRARPSGARGAPRAAARGERAAPRSSVEDEGQAHEDAVADDLAFVDVDLLLLVSRRL